MKSQSINVLDIYLDAENARHDPKSEQGKIIDHLVKNEKVLQLARDISEHGVSPIDLMAVIKDAQGHYVAIEGNRRLCALTLLNDPAKHSGSQEQIKKLIKKSIKIPKKINCIIFDKREDTDVWVERKHEGEQDGIGTRHWSPEGKLRHNSRKNKKDQNALANGLIEYSIKNNLIDKEHGKKILTTAARYLGNPFFRSTLGITSARSDEEIVINTPHSEFDSALEVFISDLIDNDAVNSRTKKKDWENYARSLIEKGIAPEATEKSYKLAQDTNSEQNITTKTGNVEAIATNPPSRESPTVPTENPNSDNTSTEPKARDNKHPDKRRYLIPTNFRVHINDPILKRVYGELKKIEVDDTTLAASLVCRAFLENLYPLFHEKVGGAVIGGQTHIVLEKVIKLIGQDNALTKKQKNSLAALRRVQSNENNVLSPKTLGANAHAGIYPNGTELKREWDNVAEILVYMIHRI